MADKQPSNLQKFIQQRLNAPSSDEATTSHVSCMSKFVLPALKCGSLANMQTFKIPNMLSTTEEAPPVPVCQKPSEMQIDLRQALNSCHALQPRASATSKSHLQQAEHDASKVKPLPLEHAALHAVEAMPDHVLPCTLDASNKVYRIRLQQPSALGRLLCETQLQVPPATASVAKSKPCVGSVATHAVQAFRFDTLSPDEQNLLKANQRRS